MEATNNPMICAHLCKNIIYDVVNYCDSFRADYQEERDSRLIQNDTGGSKTVLDRVQSDRGRLKTRILMRLRFIERRYFPFLFFSLPLIVRARAPRAARIFSVFAKYFPAVAFFYLCDFPSRRFSADLGSELCRASIGSVSLQTAIVCSCVITAHAWGTLDRLRARRVVLRDIAQRPREDFVIFREMTRE